MYGFRRGSGGAGGAGNVSTLSGGANGRITLWNGATTVTGDPSGTWSGTGHQFVIGSPTFNASDGHFTGPAGASFGPSAVGGGFTNQPAGDTIDLVSDDAGDTTQQVTIIGTLAGVDASENIMLNGITPVTSVGTYDLILALVLNGACVGTVTASETSGGLAITTIAPAALSAGLQTFAAIDGYGKVLQIVASGATTKTVGIGGYALGGGIQREPVVLTGTTKVNTTLTWEGAVQFYLGDLEATRTVTLNSIAGFDFSPGLISIGTQQDTFLSRASAGTLLVEDGSGNPMDVAGRYFNSRGTGFQVTDATGLSNFFNFLGTGGLLSANNQKHKWSSDGTYYGTPDLALSRASAGLLLVEDGSGAARDVQVRDILGVSNVLNQRNGTNAQTFRIYDSYTDASNYGRLELGDASGGFINVYARGVGTGPYSSLMLGSATGYVYTQSVFAPAPFASNALDLGSASIPALWRTGYFGTSVVTPVVSGGADSATPNATAINGTNSRAGTDTNVAGGNLTIRPGAGTGSATGSSIVFQTPTAGASGTGAQTQTTRVTIAEGQTIFDVTARPISAGGFIAQSGTGILLLDISTSYTGGYFAGSLGYSNVGNGAVVTRAHLFMNDGGTVVNGALTGPTGVTALTESSATGFATLTYAASEAVSAEFLVRIKANDATDLQSLTSRVRVSSIRKATGNTISTVSVIGTDLLAESAGGSTLSCTYTVTEGAGAVTVLANCVSSLTQTTLNASFVAETVGNVRVDQL